MNIYRATHTTNNRGNGGPSCQPCRRRFSTINAMMILDTEWLCYVIVAFIKWYFRTYFQGEKQGRLYGRSAWGTLQDSKGRWGFAFEIINLTNYVSNIKSLQKYFCNEKMEK